MISFNLQCHLKQGEEEFTCIHPLESFVFSAHELKRVVFTDNNVRDMESSTKEVR